MKPKPLGLDPPRPSLTPYLEAAMGVRYIPERRATFEALVPERFKLDAAAGLEPAIPGVKARCPTD